MKIPTFEEVAGIPLKKRTPLDIFVLENEPVGDKEEKKFRDELKALVDYVEANSPLPASITEALNSGDGSYHP